MESGTLFGSITDPQLRARIHHAILQIEEVIPTIECWHENMRYLSIGVTILKDYIIDEPLEGSDRSIRKAMRASWRPPASQGNMSFISCYKQVLPG